MNAKQLAEDWSGAYRADYNGRTVSEKIIEALIAYGFSEEDAEWIYFSKNLRWFFDGQGDRVTIKKAKDCFTEYLNRNISDIRLTIEHELGRKCSV